MVKHAVADKRNKVSEVNDNENGKLTLLFCAPSEYNTACEYIYHSCRLFVEHNFTYSHQMPEQDTLVSIPNWIYYSFLSHR